MTELEEYTMSFFKQASIFKTVSILSKIMLLAALPVLLAFFRQMSDTMATISYVSFIAMLIVWILSTRKYNFINLQIQLNMWLTDMVNKPEDFSDFVNKNDIK
jgi:hypothetical protein